MRSGHSTTPVSLVEALNADTDDLLNSFNAAGLKAVKVNQGLGEGLAFADYGIDDRFRRTVWDQVVANAEEHNEPEHSPLMLVTNGRGGVTGMSSLRMGPN